MVLVAVSWAPASDTYSSFLMSRFLRYVGLDASPFANTTGPLGMSFNTALAPPSRLGSSSYTQGNSPP